VRGISEDLDIGGEKLVKVTVGKSLGVVLASFGMSVLLVSEVPMLTKLVHEYVKQLERLRLSLGKAANPEVTPEVARYAQVLKKDAMRIDGG
jgi:hypothetical protein